MDIHYYLTGYCLQLYLRQRKWVNPLFLHARIEKLSGEGLQIFKQMYVGGLKRLELISTSFSCLSQISFLQDISFQRHQPVSKKYLRQSPAMKCGIIFTTPHLSELSENLVLMIRRWKLGSKSTKKIEVISAGSNNWRLHWAWGWHMWWPSSSKESKVWSSLLMPSGMENWLHWSLPEIPCWGVGAFFLPTILCPTPHQQPCLNIFIKDVFQSHGLFLLAWFHSSSTEWKLTPHFFRNIVSWKWQLGTSVFMKRKHSQKL